MGVAGLWEVLRPAARPRSLTALALQDGFHSPRRGFRIGIDASIWFFHAAYGKEGENPELRTLFFRCCTLMHTPFLPLFVFDGPKRPDVKRGKRIGKEAHWMTGGMKNIIEAFGYEWRTAPGEAEAELAYLNRIGVIDGILSDDVDNFLFGATLVIRNPSPNLTGNSSHPLPTTNHTTTFSLLTLRTHPSVKLTRAGLILIGLLAGGDYNKGLEGCGMKVAVALARCGFGETLLEAVERFVKDGEGEEGDGRRLLEEWLVGWREDVARELATNSQGHLPSKRVALSKTLLAYNSLPPSAPSKSKSKSTHPPTFPDLRILLYYTTPLTSETYHRSERNKIEIDWTKGEPDLGKIAAVCELYFEWGWRSRIVKRFRTLIWKGAVCRILRRAIITADRKALTAPSNSAPSTPTKKKKNKMPSPYPNIYTNEDPPPIPIRKDSECGTPSKMIAKHFSSLSLAGDASPSKRTLPPSHYDHSRAFSLSSDRDSERASDSDSDADADKEGGGEVIEKEKGNEQAEALITKIHSTRTHISTDKILEYRVEIAPAQLVRLVEGGIKGTRVEPAVDDVYADHDEDGDGDEEGFCGDSDVDDGCGDCSDEEGARKKKKKKQVKGKGKEKGGQKAPEDPNAHFRIWMPACMVQLIEPGLVEDYEEGLKMKADRKAGRGKARAAKGGSKKIKGAMANVDNSDSDDSMDSDNVRNNLKGYFALTKPSLKPPPPPPPKTKTKTKIPSPITVLDLSSPGPQSIPKQKVRSKPPPIPHVPLYDLSDTDTGTDTLSKSVMSSAPIQSPLKKPRPVVKVKAKSSPAIMRISDILSPAKSSSSAGGVGLRPFPMSLEYEDRDGDEDDDNVFVDSDDDFVNNDFDFNYDLGNMNSDDRGMNINDDPFFLDVRVSDEPPISPTPSPQTQKQGRKKFAQASSDSDAASSCERQIKKSPRKSKTHSSPKHHAIISGYQEWDSESDGPARPGSPSPMRPRPKATVSAVKSKPLSGPIVNKPAQPNGTIIEISSGEDAPPPTKLTRPPLLIARSRKTQSHSETTKSSKAGAKAKFILVPPDVNLQPSCSNDIIDLT